MFNAVIFDVDGTLVDSVKLHAQAWQMAFKRFGKEISFEEISHQIGKGGDKLLPVFLSQEELQRFGDELSEFRTELYQRDFLPRVQAFPGVRELLTRLQADGIRVALASSCEPEELQVYKKIARIGDLKLVELCADDVKNSKPSGDIFAATLKKLGNPRPNTVTVVGDSPYDVEAARNAHLQTLGVLSGGYSEEELRKAGCVDVYRDPPDLLQRYEQWAHRAQPYDLAHQQPQ